MSTPTAPPVVAERSAPAAPEVEKSILGAALLATDSEPLERAQAAGLVGEDFFSDPNRLIFEGMLALASRGDPIEPVMLREELQRRQTFELAGGSAYIASLTDGMPHTVNVEHYVGLLKDKAVLRRFARRGQAIRDAALEPSADVGALAAEVEELADLAKRNGAGGAANRVRVFTLDEYLELRLPPRQPLLSPVLNQKDLAMIYANRGDGKTWAVLSIGLGAATGLGAFGWSAPAPAPVLLVDGEMPVETLQARTGALLAGLDPDMDVADIPLRILALDAQETPVPSLDTPEGQRILDAHLGDAKLVILDNISTLLGSGPENDAEAWGPAQQFLLSLRRRGVAVLLVHHAGKGGQQRGTSRREDVLDTVVKLERPNDYRPEDGARFEVQFEKARGLTGSDVAPFEAQLITGPQGEATWSVSDIEGRTRQQVVELLATGMHPNTVASELDVHRSTVYRHRKAAIAEGVLDE